MEIKCPNQVVSCVDNQIPITMEERNVLIDQIASSQKKDNKHDSIELRSLVDETMTSFAPTKTSEICHRKKDTLVKTCDVTEVSNTEYIGGEGQKCVLSILTKTRGRLHSISWMDIL